MSVLDVTQAGSADTEVVAGILVAAAQDLIQKGQMLWHVNSVSAQAIETDVRAGRYWLAHDAGRPIGVFRYETCDPVFWPEVTDGRTVCFFAQSGGTSTRPWSGHGSTLVGFRMQVGQSKRPA